MGVMDRFLNAVRLNSDEDEYYDDEFYDDEDEDEEDDLGLRRKNRFRSRREAEEDDFDEEEDEEEYAAPKSTVSASRNYTQQTSSKVTPMRTVRRSTSSAHSSSNMQVCVIKPISIDDAREITDTLVSNQTVILNLEGLDLDVAQRIIDFSSGSCYAIGGNLQKVSNYIFVVTPSNVDISGDIQNIMSSFGDASSLHSDF